MQNKIVFLDIDGVLNDHTASGIYSEDSTNIHMINNLNLALEKTGAKVVIISNWSQVMSRDRLIKFLTERGVLENSIIDVITAKEIENNGIIQYVIDKGAFIYEYLNINDITNYVIIDDDFNSKQINSDKVVVPEKHPSSLAVSLGITSKEVEQIIYLLNG